MIKKLILSLSAVAAITLATVNVLLIFRKKLIRENNEACDKYGIY